MYNTYVAAARGAWPGGPVHIVYLANSVWPSIRGAERLLLSMCERGRSLGHEVTVVAPERSALHDACARIGVRTVVARFSPLPWELARLRSTLRALAPDIVHGMSIFPVALVRGLRLLPADGSVRYFAYVSIDPRSALPVASGRLRRPVLAVRNAIARREAQHLDAIFAASETTGAALADLRICGHVIPIPGTISVSQLEADARTASAPEMPPGAPRIGYVAFLEELKGIEDLIAALTRLRADRPSLHLVVAGDGPERARLDRLAGELGVGDNVHLLGDVDPVAPFLSALDVFVSPSHSEALGRSIMEAMALGIPCVCTDVGGNAEVIRNEQTGLLVGPHDPDALALAIRRLIDDPALARRLGDAGRALVSAAPYTLDSTLATIFGEYDGAAARVAP